MYKFLILFLFIKGPVELYAGNARQTAKGNTGATSLGADANSANPAGLVWNTHHVMGTTYARHHLIQALDKAFFNYSICKQNKGYALFYTQMGDRRLKHQQLSITYAQLFSDKFSLAMRGGFGHLKFGDNYGQKAVLLLDMGMTTKLNEQLYFGFYLLNLGRSKVITQYNERYESAVMTGISYTLSELFKLELEMEKYTQQTLNIKLGMEYQILHSFFLRGGFQSSYRRFSTGFGYLGKRLEFDSSIYYTHPVGYSLVFSLSLCIEKVN